MKRRAFCWPARLRAAFVASATPPPRFGTFSFLGLPIPGQLSVTIGSTTQLTFRETTTYGTCSNTYGGQLTKRLRPPLSILCSAVRLAIRTAFWRHRP
jgi:hypothetical protein